MRFLLPFGLPRDSMYQEESDKAVRDAKAPSGNSVHVISEHLLEDKEWAEIDLEIEQENEEMRATYLQTTELYTNEDIQGPSTSGSAKGGFLRFMMVKKICSRLFSLLTGNLCRLSKNLGGVARRHEPMGDGFWFESSDGVVGRKNPTRMALKTKTRSLTPPNN